MVNQMERAMSGAECPLAGQFAAITGGSKGIGLGIARRFVQAGASVVLLARNETALEEACDSLKAEMRADEQVHWISMDTSRPESIEAGFAAMAERIPRLNVFVANAGSGSMSPFAEMSLADWQALVDLNLTGTFLTCQAAARRMLTEPGGDNHAILAVTSIRASTVLPGRAAYSATKAAVNQLVRIAAYELAGHRIRVNALAPGITATDITLAKVPEVFDQIGDTVPLGRAATPLDTAEAALYLCSAAGQFVTGTLLTVDGGESLA
jgi:NAD(P)-dependent dehydrogenase (short-subunit alcohol dehydrogenase family)